jgi:hypothetical protein
MNLVCKMVMAAAVRGAQMAGVSGPQSWSKVRDSLVLPIDKAKNIVLPYDNPPPTENPAYSLDQLDFLTIHDPPVSEELLKSTHGFEDTVRRQRMAASKSSQRDFSIGFAEAAEAATAAFVGDKRGALELFHQSWKNVWLEPFGMIRETPSQDYGCFLTNFGSLLQTVMFGFTGLRISESDWQKYPASLPAGWSKIEIDRVYVKGQAKRLVATDGSPAQLLTA